MGEVVAVAAEELPQSVESAAKWAFPRPWAQAFALSIALMIAILWYVVPIRRRGPTPDTVPDSLPDTSAHTKN